jgi:hypothetical protein
VELSVQFLRKFARTLPLIPDAVKVMKLVELTRLPNKLARPGEIDFQESALRTEMRPADPDVSGLAGRRLSGQVRVLHWGDKAKT